MAIQKGDFVKVLKGEFKGEIAEVTRAVGNERLAVTVFGKTVIVKRDDVTLA